MQLVAYGAQDIYLTGNPQITFFKVVYRRHTNFSMECIQQTMSGNNGSSSGGKATVTISRNGDLVGRMYLEVDVSSAPRGPNDALGDDREPKPSRQAKDREGNGAVVLVVWQLADEGTVNLDPREGQTLEAGQ